MPDLGKTEDVVGFSITDEDSGPWRHYPNP